MDFGDIGAEIAHRHSDPRVNAIRIHLSDADCIDPAFPGRALPYPAPIRARHRTLGLEGDPRTARDSLELAG